MSAVTLLHFLLLLILYLLFFLLRYLFHSLLLFAIAINLHVINVILVIIGDLDASEATFVVAFVVVVFIVAIPVVVVISFLRLAGTRFVFSPSGFGQVEFDARLWRRTRQI